MVSNAILSHDRGFVQVCSANDNMLLYLVQTIFTSKLKPVILWRVVT